MRRVFLLLAAVAVCLAQTSTPPAISAYFRLAGNSTGPYPYQWLQIDPPLSLSFDGKSPHLSVNGAIGPTGPQGLPGIQGLPGMPGASVAGPTGPQGPAGTGPASGLTVESGCSTAAGCTVLGTATTLDIEPGIGEICVPQLSVSTGVMTLQCSTDTAVIAFRVEPPTASGPCNDPATNQPYSASTWAADASYFYFCVPPPGSVLPLPPGAPPLVFSWARVPLQTGW